MALNWTLASIIGVISLIPAGFPVVVSLYYYLRQRYRYVLYLNLMFTFFFTWTLIQVIALLISSLVLYQIGNYFFVPGAFFMIISFDSIARESVDPRKIYLLITACVVAIVVSLLIPSSFEKVLINGAEVIVISDLMMILFGNISLLVMTNFLYYSVRIYRNAPINLKGSARIFLSGACILFFGMISVFSLGNILDIRAVAPGLMMLIPSIGSVFLGIALAREPKLAYLLPFKVYRLIVIEVHKGIALFTHTWGQQETLADETLFSGMLQGISSLLDESLRKGNVQEIYLEEAVIIIEESREFPVACVLIATKSTRSLREALGSFSKKFFTKFASNFAMPSETSQFNPAIILVEDTFSFIPEID